MRILDVLLALDSKDFQDAWLLVFRQMGDDMSAGAFNGAFLLVWQICR